MQREAILVATDVRLRPNPDGSADATHPAGVYQSFAPLTLVFDRVQLFARATTSEENIAGPATGPRVRANFVPNFDSPRSLFTALPQTVISAWRQVGEHQVVWGRLPEPLSLVVGWMAVIRRRAFIANVVADPADIDLGPGRAARIAAKALFAATRALVRRANATIYVTTEHLQLQAPPPPGRPTLVRSNVRIDDDWFRGPRTGRFPDRPKVVLVGSNQTWNKGQGVLLAAVSILARCGKIVDVTFVGGGRLSGEIQDRARVLGISDQVNVLGQIEQREHLAQVLDEQDLFCLPSLSEGLPRAMVEAMARGLPAVGTRVGGIPELLPPDALAVPGDAQSLASTLDQVLRDPDREARSRAAIATAALVTECARDTHLIQFLNDLTSPPAGGVRR